MCSGALLFNIMYKHHMFVHVGDAAESINPKCLQTYTEESMVGRGAKMYEAACNGPFVETIQPHVLKRYLVALHLRWSVGLGR